MKMKINEQYIAFEGPPSIRHEVMNRAKQFGTIIVLRNDLARAAHGLREVHFRARRLRLSILEAGEKIPDPDDWLNDNSRLYQIGVAEVPPRQGLRCHRNGSVYFRAV